MNILFVKTTLANIANITNIAIYYSSHFNIVESQLLKISSVSQTKLSFDHNFGTLKCKSKTINKTKHNS